MAEFMIGSTGLVPNNGSGAVFHPVHQESVGDGGETSSSGTQGTQEELERLGYLLSELQLRIAEFKKLTEQGRSKIDKELVEGAHALTNQLIANVDAYEKAEEQQAKESLFSKIMNDVLTGATLLFSAATGQWGLFAVTLAFTIMSQTGVMKHIEAGLADALKKAGCSPLVANLLADVVIIVATIIITHTGGGAASKMANLGSKAARTTEEICDGAEEEMQEISSDAPKPDSSSDHDVNEDGDQEAPQSKPEPAAKPNSSLSLKVMAGMQAMMSTSFAYDAAALMVSDCSSKKEKAILEAVIEAIILIVATVAGAKGLSNMSKDAQEGSQALRAGRSALSGLSKEEQEMSTFKSLLQKLKNLCQAARLTQAQTFLVKAVNGMADVALAGEAGGNFAMGATNLHLASLTKQEGEFQSSMLIVQTLLNAMNNPQGSTNHESISSEQLSQFNQMIGDLGQAFSSMNLAVAHDMAV